MSTQQQAMQIPAHLVKELLERTGAGFSDSRISLTICAGICMAGCCVLIFFSFLVLESLYRGSRAVRCVCLQNGPAHGLCHSAGPVEILCQRDLLTWIPRREERLFPQARELPARNPGKQ